MNELLKGFHNYTQLSLFGPKILRYMTLSLSPRAWHNYQVKGTVAAAHTRRDIWIWRYSRGTDNVRVVLGYVKGFHIGLMERLELNQTAFDGLFLEYVDEDSACA